MNHHALALASTRRRAGLLAPLTMVLAFVLVACGGGEEGPAPEGAPTISAIPIGVPTVTGNLFDYPARGYGVEMPEGWTADADFLSGAGFATDAFFSPEAEEAGVKANISVTVQRGEPDVDAEAYLELKTELIRRMALDEPRLNQRDVGGFQATVAEYEPKTEGVRVEKTDVFFFRDPYVWTITLTVPAGQRAQYQDIFDRFLASYHVVED